MAFSSSNFSSMVASKSSFLKDKEGEGISSTLFDLVLCVGLCCGSSVWTPTKGGKKNLVFIKVLNIKCLLLMHCFPVSLKPKNLLRPKL